MYIYIHTCIHIHDIYIYIDIHDWVTERKKHSGKHILKKNETEKHIWPICCYEWDMMDYMLLFMGIMDYMLQYVAFLMGYYPSLIGI